VSEPVEIFSMGVVVWELVTASPLFSVRTDYETMRGSARPTSSISAVVMDENGTPSLSPLESSQGHLSKQRRAGPGSRTTIARRVVLDSR
jgi:hypothetical protein